MKNYFFTEDGLPKFKDINLDNYTELAKQEFATSKNKVEDLLNANEPPTWNNFVYQLDLVGDHLHKLIHPIFHLENVQDSDKIRKVLDEFIPLMTEFDLWFSQNKRLAEKFNYFKESDEYTKLNDEQKRAVDLTIEDLKLSGINLPDEERERYRQIVERLSVLEKEFDNNLLDSRKGWYKHITDVSDLSGVPEVALEMYQDFAKKRGLDGYVITLDYPAISPIYDYADNRELRREVYTARATQASDQGPNAGKWDNTLIIDEIARLRTEKAKLLGFNNHAEVSVVLKMAKNTNEVLDFLHGILDKAMPKAKEEFKMLQEYAKNHGIDELMPWDIFYYRTKLSQELYSFDPEEVRPYFPFDSVLDGMFKFVNLIYGITIKERTEDFDAWHPDVRLFDIFDNNEHIASFFVDPYARDDKRGGAWMNDPIIRMRIGDTIQKPIAYLCCNFPSPVGDRPSLLDHTDVETIFHEFGHGLHHMLTKCETKDVSGIYGVEHDAMEMPSQIMENWTWCKEAIDLFARHYKTGEKMPDNLFEKMYAARNFCSGLDMVYYLNRSLLDFKIYTEYDPKNGKTIRNILNEVDSYASVIKSPEWTRPENSFSHIWSGGYSAGYYSYIWAEVLSADAFSKFEENGVFDKETGHQFKESILEQGASRPAIESFVEFRGRKPSPDALLRHRGIINGKEDS